MSRATGGISLCSLLAGLGYGHEAYAQTLPICTDPPTVSCGLRASPPAPQVPEGWLVIEGQSLAFMNFPTTALSIYMDGRGPLVPVQTLTVSGTNMTG